MDLGQILVIMRSVTMELSVCTKPSDQKDPFSPQSPPVASVSKVDYHEQQFQQVSVYLENSRKPVDPKHSCFSTCSLVPNISTF